MAKPKEITIEQVKNLGNYESRRLSLTVTLDKTDDLDQVFKHLKLKVNWLLNEGEYTARYKQALAENNEKGIKDYETHKELIDSITF